MTNTKPTLHHLNLSQSQRLVWLLEELEIDYDLVQHTRNAGTWLAPDSLREQSPTGKAPTLVTSDGQVVVESAAIAGYLIRTYDKEGKFQGKGLEGNQDAVLRDEMISSFSMASLQPFTSVKLFALLGAMSDNTGGRFLEPRLSSALEYLASELTQDYFMGTSPGRPDFLLSWPVDLIVQMGWVELPAKLTEWRERVLAREGWKRAAEKTEDYDLTRFKGKKESKV